MTRTRIVVAACAALVAAEAAAQAPVKPDGLWRAVASAGLSIAGGNTESTLLNLSADAVRATGTDRLNLFGTQTYGKADGETNADLANLGVRYSRDIDERWFWFGQLEAGRDEFANLSLRTSASFGAGRHLIRTEETTFDVFVGLGGSYDRYVTPTVVADELRESYGRLEPQFGEESRHRLSATTTFRQRLAVYPNLTDTGEFRATFDAGLAVAMTDTLSLTATLGVRYNSDPGTGLETTDTLFVTGVAYKLDR